MINFLTTIVFFTYEIAQLYGDEIWEQDMSSDMKIGVSTTGYQRVDLKCGADAFFVNVTLDNDFEGVVYTRGSFNEKKRPCFKKYTQHAARDDVKLLISLKIPFDRCQTVMDIAESSYKNTLVIQHDDELIMPGDAAFNLDCTFEPEFKVSSDLTAESSQPFKSKITLVDADPSAEKKANENPAHTVESDTKQVSFIPRKGSTKDEL